MKILLLTPDIPYPTASGAAIRNYGIIRGLVDKGHQVTLLTFVQSPIDKHSNPLYQICEDVHTVPLPIRSKSERIVKLLTAQKADIEFRLASSKFEQILINLLKSNDYDVIQFSGIELGSYLSIIQNFKKSAKVVYDALNAEAELQRVIYTIDRQNLNRLPVAVYSYVQARRIKQFEKRICQTVDSVIAVSDEDHNFLAQYEGAPITVMPNGIFVDEYKEPTNNRRILNQLVFTGKMDYRPNVDAIEWFVTSILPKIRAEKPNTILTIVGRNPHPRIEEYTQQPKIMITGWVDSVQPYLHSATIFIVPLRMGSGTRLKILEAMASGCAIVSTSIGAAGLNQHVKQAILIAEDDDTFAQCIVSLLNDATLRQELGTKAEQQVRQYYDWSVLIPQLLNAYRKLGLG